MRVAETGILDDRRLVGAVLLGGGVLLVIGNALHPFLDTAGDPQVFIDELSGGAGLWSALHLVIGIGLLALAVGLVGFAGLLRDSAADAWGRAAAVVGVVGAGIFALQIVALDGIAIPILVEDAGAGGSTAALEAAIAVDLGMLTMAIFTLIGVANLLLGMAVLRSRLVGSWVALLLLAGGVLGVVAALVLIGDPRSALAINVLFRIAAALVTIGVLAAGWILYRGSTGDRAVTEEAAARR